MPEKNINSINPANFPQFLGVGAAKCGTTSLHHYLSKHPKIFLPERKELLFWHQNRNPNKAIFRYREESSIPATLTDYLNYFIDKKQGQVAGEICPSYLYYHDYVIETLKEMHPQWDKIKIFIILRDPIERIKSEYRFVRKRNLDPENLSFADSIQTEDERKANPKLLLDLHYLSLSLYYQQVKAYVDTFSCVKTFLFDDLVNEPAKLMRDLCSFLEVDPDAIQDVDLSERRNATGQILRPRSKLFEQLFKLGRNTSFWVPDQWRSKLRRYANSNLRVEDEIIYDDETIDWLKLRLIPDTARLSELIDRDLSFWMSEDQ